MEINKLPPEVKFINTMNDIQNIKKFYLSGGEL